MKIRTQSSGDGSGGSKRVTSPTNSFIRRKRRLDPDYEEEQRKTLHQVMKQNLARDFEEYKARQGVMNLGPSIIRSLFAVERTLFLALLTFRILNGFFVQTYYVPDEFWQSVEVAHNAVFGYGFLTWEWKLGIRSYLYPMVFGFAFRVLSLANIDNWSLVIKLPRIIQAFFAALTDFYLFKLSQKVSGQAVAKWTLFCQLMCWFVFYSSTRTLTNNMEALLTVLAFYLFPKLSKDSPRRKGKQWIYIIYVTLGFVIRPTAIVQFLPLIVTHSVFLVDARRSNKSWNFTGNVMTILRLLASVSLVLYLSVWLDSACYGKWTISTWNFIQMNVLRGIGSFYGTHPWHWYLSQGIPVILCSLILPLAVGLYCNRDWPTLQVTLGWTVLVYSLFAHKEFRFLYSVLPLAIHFAGSGMNVIWQFAAKGQKKGEDSEATTNELTNRRNWVGNAMLALLLATNLPLACYTSLVHQRGAIDVMKVVREHAVDMTTRQGLQPSVLFLMPCHSTPFYSHVHMNISMRFLTCEPNVFGSDQSDAEYVDEADQFYADPPGWLGQEFEQSNKTLPSLIVMFADLQLHVREFLLKNSYHPCGRVFHTHFPTSRRLSSYISAFCLNRDLH